MGWSEQSLWLTNEIILSVPGDSQLNSKSLSPELGNNIPIKRSLMYKLNADVPINQTTDILLTTNLYLNPLEATFF